MVTSKVYNLPPMLGFIMMMLGFGSQLFMSISIGKKLGLSREAPIPTPEGSKSD
jgi:hypothetical protein